MSAKTTYAGLADLIASLPHMVGVTPHDATVVVGMREGQVVVIGQAYHQGEDITAQLDKAMRVMAQRAGCDTVVCAAYGMSEEQAATSAASATRIAETHGLQVAAQVRVEPDLRLYADQQGQWHELPTVAQSDLLAHEAANSPSPATSREAIVQQWNQHGTLSTRDCTKEPAMRALTAILTGLHADRDELASLAGWLSEPIHRDALIQALTHLADGAEYDAAIPAVIITHAAAATPETIQTGLRRACATLDAPCSTELLTAAAAHSFATGNGMHARIQAEAAIATGGNVRLALLLRLAITEGVQPPTPGRATPGEERPTT